MSGAKAPAAEGPAPSSVINSSWAPDAGLAQRLGWEHTTG